MRCLPRILSICVVVLAGCADQPPLTGQAQADAETQAACRQRAEEVYNQQNRAQIYSPSPSVNTPYSANYLPNQTDRGLSQLFVHDKMVSECVRNNGTGAERSQTRPSLPH